MITIYSKLECEEHIRLTFKLDCELIKMQMIPRIQVIQNLISNPYKVTWLMYRGAL